MGFAQALFIEDAATAGVMVQGQALGENADADAGAFCEKRAPGADNGAVESPLSARLWCWLKGKKARDALVLGMWSKHYQTKKHYRTRHDLIGAQYKGYFLATFANSHNHQVVAAGLSRTVAEKALGAHWLLEAGYKFGPMYGYREGIPQVHRFSVLPLASLGVSCRMLGVDLNLVPGNAFSFNMRINF